MGMTVTIDEDFHAQKHYAMAQLSAIRDGLEDEMRSEILAIMEKVKLLAIELCPKQSGALASSISLENGSLEAGDFANYQIFAGNDSIINPITKRPTSEYALFVHEGHTQRDGSFFEGVPFLTDALAQYENEIESCIDRALKEISKSEPSASDVTAQSD